MNIKAVPVTTRKTQRRKHSYHVEAWRNFAQRITKNLFVKEHLIQRENGYCGWCSFKINQNPVIHHTCYDHVCSYHKQIEVPSPTPNNPNKTRSVPNCKSCNKENPDRFLACMSKLTIVHNRCNKAISQIPKVDFN